MTDKIKRDAPQKISELYFKIVEKCALRSAIPLPKRKHEIGDPESGWYTCLNATGEMMDSINPYHAYIKWNGFPAGIVSAFEGCLICDGETSSEDELIAWLEKQ